MKKILGGLLVILLLFVVAVYIFIPASIRISSSASVGCVNKSILTFLNDQQAWNHWWPGHTAGQSSTDSTYSYDNYRFRLTEPYNDGAAIELSHGNIILPSTILLLPAGKDSVDITWQTTFTGGFNPFSRISAYLESKSAKQSMDTVLQNLVDFVGQTKNIYGFTIKRTTFRDTVLLATKFSSTVYPSTNLIYQKIDSLRKYIAGQNASETNPPMLSINSIDSAWHNVMIAIPISKRITAGENMFISMMVPMEGRFLETQVTGGPLTLQKAHEAVSTFMSDRMLTPPAIPFEILVTDRRNEPDTAKWMTKIFYPTMWNN